MLVMERKFQSKEKIEAIKKQLPCGRVRRPKSFNFKRRDSVYFFSEDSTKGILKRVPIRNASYRMDELWTVEEKHDVGKLRNEIWSDVPLHSSETSEADKNNTAAGKDDSHQSGSKDGKKNTDLKLLDETERSESCSKALKKLSILEAYKESLKTKVDGKKSLKGMNKNEYIFHKSLEAPKKKKPTSKDFEESYSENLKGPCLDRLYEKSSACNKKVDSLTNLDDSEDMNKILSKTWTEGSLRDAFDRMSIKQPITEL